MRVTVNDTSLYFDVEGAGLVPEGPALRERPTVLLLHGGPGFDHTYFKPSMSALADAAQLIYLDQRGQGRSGRPPVETCTVEQMADDAAACLRLLGVERPVVLGHSFGGFVALHLALHHPAAVGRLVLADTAATIADLSESLAILRARQGPEAPPVAERLFDGEWSEAVMADFLRLVLPAYAHPSRVGVLAEILTRIIANPEVGSAFFRRRATAHDVRARLGEIRVPTLVVVGDYDWLTTPRMARELAAGIPGAQLAVIPDAGHFAFAEQPEAFFAAVRPFLVAD